MAFTDNNLQGRSDVLVTVVRLPLCAGHSGLQGREALERGACLSLCLWSWISYRANCADLDGSESVSCRMLVTSVCVPICVYCACSHRREYLQERANASDTCDDDTCGDDTQGKDVVVRIVEFT